MAEHPQAAEARALVAPFERWVRRQKFGSDDLGFMAQSVAMDLRMLGTLLSSSATLIPDIERRVLAFEAALKA
jgi:hypothetical protein